VQCSVDLMRNVEVKAIAVRDIITVSRSTMAGEQAT